MSEYVLMDAFEAEYGATLRRDEIVGLMREAFVEGLNELGEIDAVAVIARQNYGRLPMAVASGESAAIVLATLQVTGLKAVFDVGGDD
jgi:hypothetical protein